MPALRNWVDSGFISPSTFEKLQRFAALIHSWNPKINLTGHKSLQEIEDVLVGESVAALSVLKARDGSVLDIGSGAGIPGLVWAACEASLRITSLEARHKKVAFQKEAMREIGLEAEVIPGRFPEAVAGRKFDFIVSRGLRFDDSSWSQTQDLLSSDGLVVRFSSPGTTEDRWRMIPASERTTLLLRP